MLDCNFFQSTDKYMSAESTATVALDFCFNFTCIVVLNLIVSFLIDF